MKTKETATARIAVTKSTHQRLRDFSHGLGVSQDDAIKILLEMVRKPNEDELLCGRRLRSKIAASKEHPNKAHLIEEQESKDKAAAR
jgi:hypothetical protein